MGASARNYLQDRTSAPSPAESIGNTESLHLSLITDQPGLVEFGGSPRVVVSIHVGPSVEVDCRRGGARHRGTNIHGDIEIIPPKMPGVWELKTIDTALVIGVKPQLLRRVIEDSGADPSKLEVRNRFQARDPQIEHIAWALKAEMEKGYPCGRVYTDSLATGLAAVLVRNHSSLALPSEVARAGLPVRKLRRVLAFIEDNLSQDLGLSEIAEVGGLSVSHFKAQFRKSVGVPAHQYLIRRRVERAAMLLRNGKLSVGQVALETGFCHQSHLAFHTRRVLGLTPQEIRNTSS
jgi:AraC family transcriptional regulator